MLQEMALLTLLIHCLRSAVGDDLSLLKYLQVVFEPGLSLKLPYLLGLFSGEPGSIRGKFLLNVTLLHCLLNH